MALLGYFVDFYNTLSRFLYFVSFSISPLVFLHRTSVHPYSQLCIFHFYLCTVQSSFLFIPFFFFALLPCRSLIIRRVDDECTAGTLYPVYQQLLFFSPSFIFSSFFLYIWFTTSSSAHSTFWSITHLWVLCPNVANIMQIFLFFFVLFEATFAAAVNFNSFWTFTYTCVTILYCSGVGLFFFCQ